jgi:hypothetical protein
VTSRVKIGGTWRQIDRAYVKVGGAWRDCGLAYVKVGGAWREWLEAFPAFLTAASGGSDVVGYDAGYYGTLVGDPLGDGNTLTLLYDYEGSGADFNVAVSWETSDLGAAYLESVEINGITYTRNDAYYVGSSMAGGRRFWNWDGIEPGLVAGETYGVRIKRT